MPRALRALHRFGGFVLLAGGAAGLATCATNPVTGKSEFSLISESQEIAMGRDYSVQVSREMGVYPDSAVQRYVRAIGTRMAAATERPRLPWTFTVVDDPVVNAFALPGGYIFVTRGILAHLNSEAELATVLGHEIGHVTAKHSVRQMSRAQLAQLGLVAGSILSSEIAQGAGLISSGLGILFLKYGRDDERQADQLGFRYALRDGYDVRRMVDVFATLQRVSAKSGQRIPEWLSTHPDPGDRIEATRQRLQRVTVNLDSLRVNREGYLAAIDGLVYGDDPRQGFFQGSRFLHPDLEFQLDFPPGWKTQNAPQQVVGASPGQDALVGLTVTGQDPPRTALQEFLGRSGIQGGTASGAPIHGNPAATAPFSATTEDGTQLRGYVAFVSFNGLTYRLLAYGAASAFRGYDAAFRGFIGSFRRLTDPAALAVQPNRIRIETVSRAMTLAEFNQQHPSTVPIAELALINGMEPATLLQAGEKVKTVGR
jgi:predicted Zn-dependent protease